MLSHQATAGVVPRFLSRFFEEEKEIHYLPLFLNLHSASMLVCKLQTTKDKPCAPHPPSETLSNNNNRNIMTTVSNFGSEVPKEIGATSQWKLQKGLGVTVWRTPHAEKQEPGERSRWNCQRKGYNAWEEKVDGSCQQKISSELGYCCVGNKVWICLCI